MNSFHVFAIDTPWAVGKVNCYLIEDDPLTLIDTGPNTGTAIVELEASLASVGRRLADIERIVVTHQHADHCGLAAILAHVTEAEVCCLDELVPWLSEGPESMRRDDEFAAALMRRHGVSKEAVTTLRAVSGNFRAFGPGPVQVGTALTHGGTLGFAGRSLRVWHRPGHSPTCTIFHDEATGELFGGDHILGNISSNPLVSRGPHTAEGERPNALRAYIASMRETAAMDITTVLPGHGNPVLDVAPLVEKRIDAHEKRAAKIAQMLEDGPRSAYELARTMWRAIALQQAFLTLSEVLGHLDLLVERGEVVEDDSGDVTRFALV
ncbi:MAG: hypothetical protein QOF76_1777 [Solirubrobacteraceae bacterium]|jgi:glyoxylase-like metal-dependent hydrolase (beta-lactamase superfamily II)|nr:hypothetical protein [Solirubrobacteraceae bacterium]